jgi:hypothetical protein
MEIQEIIIGVILAVIVIGGSIYINGFKNWLVWAVSEAEAIFGSKTGKLKLRYVYDMAVERFPMIAKFIPFALFGKLVDGALEIMRDMIENNKTIADAITDEIKEELTEVE